MNYWLYAYNVKVVQFLITLLIIMIMVKQFHKVGNEMMKDLLKYSVLALVT